LQPKDFQQPVLQAMRHDVFLCIDKHALDSGSVINVLCDVIAHCLGAARSKRDMDNALIVVTDVIRREAEEIFKSKSSLLIMEEE
jgi:Holliday junction resolvase RusA-like endonuclease